MPATLRPLNELAIITRPDAHAAGLDDQAIARKIRCGDWYRVRHGSYMAADLWRQLDDRDRHRARAVAVSRRWNSPHAWSHVTALAHFGQPLWDLPLDLAHVTRLDGRAGRVAAGVAQHCGATYVGDLTVRDGQLVTSGTRTALDVATTCDTEHGVVVVGGMLHAGETSLEQLRQTLLAMSSWPETIRLRRVVRLADPRPESVAEHRFVYWCDRIGLPAPVPQLEVPAGGRRFRLDFAWPELRLWVEIDGRSKYDRWLRPGQTPGEAVFEEKRREDLIREETGWLCLRITWADLADPVRLERRLRRAMQRRAG